MNITVKNIIERAKAAYEVAMKRSNEDFFWTVERFEFETMQKLWVDIRGLDEEGNIKRRRRVLYRVYKMEHPDVVQIYEIEE